MAHKLKDLYEQLDDPTYPDLKDLFLYDILSVINFKTSMSSLINDETISIPFKNVEVEISSLEDILFIITKSLEYNIRKENYERCETLNQMKAEMLIAISLKDEMTKEEREEFKNYKNER